MLDPSLGASCSSSITIKTLCASGLCRASSQENVNYNASRIHASSCLVAAAMANICEYAWPRGVVPKDVDPLRQTEVDPGCGSGGHCRRRRRSRLKRKARNFGLSILCGIKQLTRLLNFFDPLNLDLSFDGE